MMVCTEFHLLDEMRTAAMVICEFQFLSSIVTERSVERPSNCGREWRHIQPKGCRGIYCKWCLSSLWISNVLLFVSRMSQKSYFLWLCSSAYPSHLMLVSTGRRGLLPHPRREDGSDSCAGTEKNWCMQIDLPRIPTTVANRNESNRRTGYLVLVMGTVPSLVLRFLGRVSKETRTRQNRGSDYILWDARSRVIHEWITTKITNHWWIFPTFQRKMRTSFRSFTRFDILKTPLSHIEARNCSLLCR